MTGLIKNYNSVKGYGFIIPLIGKPDTTEAVFFHVSSVLGRQRGQEPVIPRGAECSFDLVRAERGGVQATNVCIRHLSGSALIQRPECA
jgi:Cold shock proteins